jgi:hypothetical protein
MGFALSLLSWSIEILGGGWFCYIYWAFPGTAEVPGPGRALVESFDGVVTGIFTAQRLSAHPPLLTQDRLAWLFVFVYLAFHALACARALALPLLHLYRLGVRRRASTQEVQRFTEVFATLDRTRTAMPTRTFLRPPLMWCVHDDAQGMQLRFEGPVLVVDRALLFSPHFSPLLARELAHINSFDWLVRMFYAMLPPLCGVPLMLCGLPLGVGRLLLYPFWLAYWRWRVYAADEYAACLGQRQALKRALDQLRWLLDGGKATAGGRWWFETPYIESRIERLNRLQSPYEELTR